MKKIIKAKTSLFLIYEDFKHEVKWEPVFILSETVKTYKLNGNHNHACRYSVGKDEINKMNTKYIPYCFCDNIYAGIELFICHYENKIEGAKVQLGIYEDLLNKAMKMKLT